MFVEVSFSSLRRVTVAIDLKSWAIKQSMNFANDCEINFHIIYVGANVESMKAARNQGWNREPNQMEFLLNQWRRGLACFYRAKSAY